VVVERREGGPAREVRKSAHPSRASLRRGLYGDEADVFVPSATLDAFDGTGDDFVAAGDVEATEALASADDGDVASVDDVVSDAFLEEASAIAPDEQGLFVDADESVAGADDALVDVDEPVMEVDDAFADEDTDDVFTDDLSVDEPSVRKRFRVKIGVVCAGVAALALGVGMGVLFASSRFGSSVLMTPPPTVSSPISAVSVLRYSNMGVTLERVGDSMAKIVVDGEVTNLSDAVVSENELAMIRCGDRYITAKLVDCPSIGVGASGRVRYEGELPLDSRAYSYSFSSDVVVDGLSGVVDDLNLRRDIALSEVASEREKAASDADARADREAAAAKANADARAKEEADTKAKAESEAAATAAEEARRAQENASRSSSSSSSVSEPSASSSSVRSDTSSASEPAPSPSSSSSASTPVLPSAPTASAPSAPVEDEQDVDRTGAVGGRSVELSGRGVGNDEGLGRINN
jgi:hypothetical protein